MRQAVKSDLDALVSLDARARRGDEGRISFVNSAIESRYCLVLESRAVVGYVITTPAHFFGHDFIDLLYVLEERRREGVGSQLLAAAVRSASTQRVFSSTNESNAPMQQLFGSSGWSLSGRLSGLDEGDPELVYFVDT